METKLCKTKRENFNACGLIKPIGDFYKGSSLCKECSKLLGKTRSDYHRQHSKNQYKNNKEYYRQKGIEYRENNKEYFIKYREENKEQINENLRTHYQNNKDYYKEKTYKWKDNNPDKWREFSKNGAKKSREKNPHIHRWRYLLKNTIEKFDTNKENVTFVSLGYSPSEFRDFMEKLNPNWRDFEIDHKIPLSWFKNDTPPNIPNDFRNLHLKNKSENSSKKNYYMDDVSEDYWGIVKEYLKEDVIVKHNL
jgi:hypothetical protein